MARDKTDGSTALSLASAEKTQDIIGLSLEHGPAINSHNKPGQTVFMEARLWGRAGNVQFLLQQREDKAILDLEGRKAYDLATADRAHERERENRSCGSYKEDHYDADRQCKAILRMLQDRPETSKLLSGLRKSTNVWHCLHSFHNEPMTSSTVLSTPIEHFS